MCFKSVYESINSIRHNDIVRKAIPHVYDTIKFNSIKQFETRLDKFWSNHDVMFDWTAEITGTGDRSVKLETVLESTIV